MTNLRRMAAAAIVTTFVGVGSSAAATQETVATTTPTTTATTSPPVPTEFRAIADELGTDLTKFRAGLSTKAPKGAAPAAFGGELLTANGNQGEALLAPGATEKDRFLLDALARIGARAVTVDIPYPLLDPNYPRNDEYLAFYRQVAADVRQRGMQLFIETQVVFTGTAYSPLKIDYAALPLDVYLGGRTQQTLRIAQELHPDYLAFTTEQRTDAMLTKQNVTTDRYIQFVNDTVAAVHTVKGVRVGAGSGTWENGAFVERAATDTQLDFIDIHVYPLAAAGQNFLDVARRWSRLARKEHKQVVIGEAWLYKVSAAELGNGLDFTAAYPRDSFAYWAPLDASFVNTIGDLAHSQGISLVTFYWVQFLFGYPALEATSLTDARRALVASNQASTRAITARQTTLAGRAFQRQVARNTTKTRAR